MASKELRSRTQRSCIFPLYLTYDQPIRIYLVNSKKETKNNTRDNQVSRLGGFICFYLENLMLKSLKL